jgi:hypothetical protein
MKRFFLFNTALLFAFNNPIVRMIISVFVSQGYLLTPIMVDKLLPFCFVERRDMHA